jgi:hypothetical protein
LNLLDGAYLSPPTTLPAGTLPPVNAAPPGAVVRARAFAPDHLPSPVRSQSYVTGHDERLATVPAVFLTGTAEETFYAPNGIFAQVGGGWPAGVWEVEDPRFDYNFAVMRGQAFERPVSLEVVAPGNQLVARTDVGARFSGSQWSRPQYQLKAIADIPWNFGAHSKPQINLFFRGDYGLSRFEKKDFIPHSSLSEWDTMRLRAGKHDPYNPFVIDEAMRRSFAAMNAPSPQGLFVTLFINGQFKNYFNLTERPRSSFFQDFYKTNRSFDVYSNWAWEDGDSVAFDQMITFFKENDFTSQDVYEQGAAIWDMTNVADYIIINAWAATQDWPENNFVVLRERTQGALWRFSMWDAEGAIGSFGQSKHHNAFESELHLSSGRPFDIEVPVALVFRRAHQNPEFRLLFADRLQKHFFNDGVMTRPRLEARWSAMRNQVEPLIQAVFGGFFDNGFWEAWADRDSVFLSHARAAGLWPGVVAPTITPASGETDLASTVTIGTAEPNGAIFFTMDGTDPRAIGGAAQGTAYTEPIILHGPVTVKARVRSSSGEWSPLAEAVFVPPPFRIVVTELNYNPPGSDDATEFLELTNVSDHPAPLNGAHFTKGLTFTFGDVTLASGASIVLVKDPVAFADAYPDIPIGGVFTGSLDNSGETITLNDFAGAVIFSFTYGDSNTEGWPPAPDGDGRTLVLRRPFHTDTNPDSPHFWRPSTAVGGAPGQVDSTRFGGYASADVDEDGHSALVEYAFGTSDQSAEEQPLYTTHLDESGAIVITASHPIAADDVVLEAVESTDLAEWSSATLIEQYQTSGLDFRSTWRSTLTGERVFLRLNVRKN